MGIIPSKYSKSQTRHTNFDNYLLIVDAYYKITKFYLMENITIEEVMDKLYMFQERFGKSDEFGWWDMDRIQTDDVTKFTYKDFHEGFYVHRVQLESSPGNEWPS